MMLIKQNYIFMVFCVFALITKSVQNNCKEFSQFEEHRCICGPYHEVCNHLSFIQLRNEIVRTSHGEVEFIFQNLNFCKNTEYTVHLNINDKIMDPKNCTLSNKRRSNLLHSGKKLLQCSNNCTNISNDISIKFNYVFTGCYTMNIIATNKTKELLIFNSDPIFIYTEYKKDFNATNFNLFPPSFSQTFNATNIEIIFISSRMIMVPSINMTLRKLNCAQNCTINSVTKIIPNNYSFNSIFTRCVQPHGVYWNCSYLRDLNNKWSYSCYYFNLEPGLYNLRYQLSDSRCNLVPHDSCSKNTNLNITYPANIKRDIAIFRNKLPAYVYILITLTTTILLTCLLYFIYHHFCRKKNTELHLPIKILLVYARDHYLFAEVIEELKFILSSVPNTLVFDVADEIELFEGRDRIENIISNPKTTIIFFVNKCSIVLDDSSYFIEYIEPDCQDKHFQYAVEQLKRRDLKDFYIVGIKKSDLHKFKYLNAEFNFVLPSKITNLLKNVFTKNAQFDKQLITNFKKKIKDYKNFTKNNPLYYNHILNNN